MNLHLLVLLFLTLASRNTDAIGRRFVHLSSQDVKLRPPIIINTWNFTDANKRAWDTLASGKSALDAVEAGCRQCQVDRCDGTVGWGGSPSETGETTLDAMIMDGDTLNVGAVGGLRRVKDAIGVARKVLELTNHSLLVGDMATAFALNLGYKEESLYSSESKKIYHDWLLRSCQPNYWVNVVPNPRQSCGPYHFKTHSHDLVREAATISPDHLVEIDDSFVLNYANSPVEYYANHDTVGIVALDSNNRVASATSTNGSRHKILGRVGDSPIPGAGSYADSHVGAAASTGDGDVIMRHLLAYQAVENLRKGFTAQVSAQKVIDRMTERTGHPFPEAAVIVLSIDGTYGAACAGFKKFPYVISDPEGSCITKEVECSI